MIGSVTNNSHSQNTLLNLELHLFNTVAIFHLFVSKLYEIVIAFGVNVDGDGEQYRTVCFRSLINIHEEGAGLIGSLRTINRVYSKPNTI